MSKRIILGVAGATVFIAGILAGMIVSGGMPAFARSSTTMTAEAHSSASSAGYCQLYENTLASHLGKSTTELENANAAALRTVIHQMAKDGTITSKQQSHLLKMVQLYGSNPCSHLNQIAQNTKGWHRNASQMMAGARQSLAASVATSLGISTATLNSDLAAGQTIPQIASARHVSIGAVNKAYLATAHSLLSQAVSKGDLTESQANTLFSRITTAVNSGHYPLLQPSDKGTPPSA